MTCLNSLKPSLHLADSQGFFSSAGDVYLIRREFEAGGSLFECDIVFARFERNFFSNFCDLFQNPLLAKFDKDRRIVGLDNYIPLVGISPKEDAEGNNRNQEQHDQTC